MQANSLTKMQTLLPIAVRAVTKPHDENALLSVKELAAALDPMALRTIYSKIEAGNWTAAEFAMLVKAYAKIGDFTLFDLMLPEGYGIAPYDCTCQINHSMDDEAADMVQLTGEVITKYRIGDKKGAARMLPRIKGIIPRMEKEIQAA